MRRRFSEFACGVTTSEPLVATNCELRYVRTAVHPLGILTFQVRVELFPKATVDAVAVKLPLASTRHRLRGGSSPVLMGMSAAVTSPVSSDASSSGPAPTAQPIESAASRERMIVSAV